MINDVPVVVNMRELKRRLFLTVVSVNVLEAIRFYVSFACSFAFAERAVMEGNAIIRTQVNSNTRCIFDSN